MSSLQPKLKLYHFAIAFVVLGMLNEIRRAWDYHHSVRLLNSFLREYAKYVNARLSKDNEAETAAHMRLCEDQIAVQRLLDNMGQGRVTVYPPAIIAGARLPVDFAIVLEMFNPEVVEAVGETGIIEAILRAQGEYRKLARKALLGSLNPSNWLSHVVLDPLMAFPFAVLERAGFARRKMEQSLAGKLLRFILGIIGIVVTTLGFIRTLEELQIMPEGAFATWARSFILSIRQMP